MEGFLLILAVLMIVSIIQYFRSPRRRVWFATGVFSLVLMFLFSGELPLEQAASATSTATPDANAVASAADGPAIPESQAAFTDVIATARDVYDAAANDLAKGGERPRRGQAICAALPSPEISNWIGTVYRLTTSNKGLGVLSVELPGDIWLSTSPSELFDAFEKTLIEPESPLFATLSTLETGQMIAISGTFFKDTSGVDCYREMSLLMDGTMGQPEFIFRFTDVRPAP